MDRLKTLPSVSKAAAALDKADHALETALQAGKSWENTPLPDEYHLHCQDVSDLWWPELLTADSSSNTSDIQAGPSSAKQVPVKPRMLPPAAPPAGDAKSSTSQRTRESNSPWSELTEDEQADGKRKFTAVEDAGDAAPVAPKRPRGRPRKVKRT